MIKFPVQLLTEGAQVPLYGSDGAAGLDLHADMTTVDSDVITLPPHRWEAIPTGVSMAIPNGLYGRIAPRSGLAFKYGIDVLAGVIDSDYRGEIKVILINHDDKEYTIKHGDRIAQLILTPYGDASLYVAESLDGTERGSGGFGSTGT